LSLAEPSSISDSDVVVYISYQEPRFFIPGALFVPRTEFLNEDNTIKTVPELARMLGENGISENDSLVLYGDCLKCGDPTFIYMIMRYLGHQRLRILAGGIEEWIGEGMAVEIPPGKRSPTNYTPSLRPEIFASYEYFRSSNAQIVDVRTSQEFARERIPGALNIESDQVLNESRIKDHDSLAEVFGVLTKDRPVVVYSLNGGKGSLVCFALQLMGYDARLYTWRDWLASRPALMLELVRVQALPNPSLPGPIKINAVLQSVNESANQTSVLDNQTRLKVMGCVTCEPITVYAGGSLSRDKGDGVVLGSYGKAKEGYLAPNGQTLEVEVGLLSNDQEVARIVLDPVGQYSYAGTWDASQAEPGIYNLTLTVYSGDLSKVFDDALSVEIIRSLDRANQDQDRFTKLSKN